MFARTPRLMLRPGWPEDARALHAAISDERVAMKLARLPWPYTPEHAEAWLATPPPHNAASLLVFDDPASAPRLVGGIGLSPHAGGGHELGYWFTPAAWGRGYATEAGRAVLGIARHALGLRRIVSGHFVDNPASGRVLAKLGFRVTGREPRECLARGASVECVTMERVFDAGEAALAP